MKDFKELITEFTDWSLVTFKEATPKASLQKCREEINEIDWEIFPGHLNKSVHLTEEYVDAIMCLFDSAARCTITAEEIITIFEYKLNKNKKREWIKNENNTYSHK